MKRRGVCSPVWRILPAAASPRAVPSTLASSLIVLGMAVSLAGCGGDDLFSPEELKEFATLQVAYGNPGATTLPCDDYLPLIDGVFTDREWSSAEPLYVRMSGADGTGGNNVFLEIRALWADNARLAAGAQNRIYFLVRYQDNDRDNTPDQLVYGTRSLLTGEIVPTRIPTQGMCDEVILNANSWTRVNPNGREDQVMILLADGENPTDLVAANRRILASVGPEFPTGVPIPGAKDLDVWIWRAGRTNIHPVPMFAFWENYSPGNADPSQGQKDVPSPNPSNFTSTCGFFEDGTVDGLGSLTRDEGFSPYVRNFFADRDADGQPDDDRVPARITEAEPRGRSGGGDGGMQEEDKTIVNADLSKDLALWWPTSKRFTSCDTIATSRPGTTKFKWSQRLLPGEVDQVRGWGVQTPTGSSRDVRGKGFFTESADKGFSVWVVEGMRDFSTGNPDDLEIVFGRAYRMVLGIYDASGSTASGSQEINLKFQPRPNNLPPLGDVNQCQ